MATFIWFTFATIIMIGVLLGVIIVVSALTRCYENAMAKRRGRMAA